MTEQAAPNEEQFEYWNVTAGPKWVAMQETLDQQIGHLGLAMLDQAAIQPGDTVLDLGCGCGATAIEIVRRVGAEGTVIGLDLSHLMLERARNRAHAAQLTNVDFIQGDAQIHAFQPGSFDVAVSRFGVMFFQDPPAAFGNIRRGLKRGGRLVFICWRSVEENPWVLEPMMAVADLVELPPPPEPGEPGPFSLADPDRLRSILDEAGFQEVALEPFDTTTVMAGGGGLDEAVEFYFQIGPLSRILAEEPPAKQDQVRRRLHETLGPKATRDGIRFPAAAWIVSAKNPA